VDRCAKSFPGAGLGTRFLPASKVVARKCCRSGQAADPDAVDEAVDAGADTLIFVTNRYKHAIADYFDVAYELEHKLERAGKTELLGSCRAFCQTRALHFRHPG
jgi:UTP--glucose-1-phosphate uridylyltransferase